MPLRIEQRERALQWTLQVPLIDCPTFERSTDVQLALLATSIGSATAKLNEEIISPTALPNPRHVQWSRLQWEDTRSQGGHTIHLIRG